MPISVFAEHAYHFFLDTFHQDFKYVCIKGIFKLYYFNGNIHLSNKGDLSHEPSLSPLVKYFTDRPKVVLLLWILYVFFCLVFAMHLCASFICALWSPAGKGLTSWLSFVVYNR